MVSPGVNEMEMPLEAVRCRILPDGRMAAEDAATYLGRRAQTLANWRLQQKGPRWIKVGGRIFYRRSDLDAFIAGERAA